MSAPYDKNEYDPLVTFAFEQITIDGTAGGIALTATVYDVANSTTGGPAKMATIQVETASVRMVIKGPNAVTSTVGELLAAGDRVIIWGIVDIKSVRFIRVAGSGQLNVHYSR